MTEGHKSPNKQLFLGLLQILMHRYIIKKCCKYKIFIHVRFSCRQVVSKSKKGTH